MASVTIRSIDLHYDVSGSGPELLWGHGLTSSRAREDVFGLLDWNRMRSAARVVRYDARGHGESDSTPDPETYHWRELALDQLALADALSIDRYIAAGASMGCATALHAAVIAPARIRGLLLAIPPTAWASRAAQQSGYEVSAGLVDAGELDTLVAGAEVAPTADPFIGIPAWKESFAEMVRSTDPVRLARILRGAAVTDLPEASAIAALRVPTLVLAWTGDPGHPMSTAERLVELMPHAELVIASTFDELLTWTATATAFLRSL